MTDIRRRRVAKSQRLAARAKLSELKSDVPSFSTLQKRIEGIIAAAHQGSVNAASKATGVPLGTMQRIAAGQTANAKIDTLRKIAACYSVSLSWLIAGDGPIPEVLKDAPIPVMSFQEMLASPFTESQWQLYTEMHAWLKTRRAVRQND